MEGTKHSISEVLMLDASDAMPISAKEGRGVPEVLEAIIARIPPPSGDPQAPLKALIFDSWFDNYQGVIVLTRVVDGAVRPGMKIKVMSNDRTFEVMEVGQFTPKRTKKTELLTGEVGLSLREYERSRGRQNRRHAHGCRVSRRASPFLGIKK